MKREDKWKGSEKKLQKNYKKNNYITIIYIY